MITVDDLNPHDFPMTSNQKNNLETLSTLLTILEDEFRKTPGSFLFTITSGLRSMADHYRIYKLKGIDSPPLGSRHLLGMAADISDPIGVLATWAQSDGLQHLERLNLYCEDPAVTKKYLHVQDGPPHSGNRFFRP